MLERGFTSLRHLEGRNATTLPQLENNIILVPPHQELTLFSECVRLSLLPVLYPSTIGR